MFSPLKTSLYLAILFGSFAVARGEEIVKWPSLKKLDDLAERCEALSDAKNIKALRGLVASVKAAGEAVEKDAPPANAKDLARVKVLQEDLKSVTDALGNPATQDGEELLSLCAGIHPIVEQLMEASGMPHVHETAPKK